MHRTISMLFLGLLGAGVAGSSLGCSSTGIAVREAFGQAKREQLVDRVQDARDEQEEAKEQFATTLEEFKALTGFEGGDLEATYSRLSRELGRSEDQAGDVRAKIRSVERVGDALFREWTSELDAYESDTLRRASEDQLRATERRYSELVGAMHRAEDTMEPVLSAFRDQVLFLKHNLNAQAIASLETSVGELESDIERLINEMEASIAEANAFIDAMDS
ncbi:MAG: DNA repair ATPase [Phycisphaeraceae bacterium]|nr:MAG: DNA repair ATPase [Phycisphaeraceae bacterium]